MVKQNRVGEVFVSNEGCEFVIVEYVNSKNVIIEFCDEYKVRKNITYSQCNRGSVKNPYHPSVYGYGYLGLMSDGSKPKTKENGKMTREYEVWKNMIMRVYCPKWHETHPSYKGTILEECLHCYAYFLEYVIRDIPNYEYWLKHPNEGVALDKDVRGNGSKVYSRDTLMFVTQSENSRESVKRCGTLTQSIEVYGVNIKTGERTREFENISEASKELGVNGSNISACLNGRYKTSGGYKWFKVE